MNLVLKMTVFTKGEKIDNMKINFLEFIEMEEELIYAKEKTSGIRILSIRASL